MSLEERTRQLLDPDDELRLVLEAAPGLTAAAARLLLDALYRPLALRVSDLADADRADTVATSPLERRPYIVSVSGLPGTGKSTLAAVLARWLERSEGRRVATLSLDDLYLGRVQREELGRTQHPLFAVRGVPGTHDLERGRELFRRLLSAGTDDVIPLPRFDKLADDLFPEVEWPVCVGRPDLVVCEGWFWGARPSKAAALEVPINPREAEEDPHGTWRRAVHRALGEGYPELFGLSDFHVHLCAPDHGTSVRWRVEQGRQERRARGLDPDGLDAASVERFLQLFERVGSWPVHIEHGLRVHLSPAHLVAQIEEVDERAFRG